MIRIAFALIGALLLAACADMAPQTASATPKSMSSGVGHPDNTYPGPRPY